MKKVYLYASQSPSGRRVLKSPVWKKSDRELFLKEYIDLIGRLGEENNSLKWWATDIASKNRFLSTVPFVLQKFLEILKAVEADQSSEDCVVADVPFEVAEGVKQALEGRGVEVIWVGLKFKYLYNKVLIKLRRYLGIFAHVFESLFRWLRIRVKLRGYVQAMDKQKAAYVIRSFIAKRSFDTQSKYRDVFFGPLPGFLRDQGKNVIIFADIFGEFDETLGLVPHSDTLIVPLEYFLSFSDIAWACFSAVHYTIQVPKDVRCFGYSAEHLIRETCWQNDSKIQAHQFLHYFAMVKFLKHFTVDTFLLTYENNPWEKMCMLALREHSPRTKILGYQHNVVPQASVNLFISRYEESIIPRPDRVITGGETPKDIIHRYETCAPSAITVGCGLRFEYLFNIPLWPKSNHGRILLALEGVPQIVPVVNYVLDQIGGHGRYQLKIRTHPVLPVEKFQGGLNKDIAGLGNLTISRARTLKEDLEWADIVIYWGSTVGIEALSIGKPVINFDIGYILNYDPLFDCPHLKWQVNQESALTSVIEMIYNLPLNEFTHQQKMARAYVNRYFTRISPEQLARFII